MKNLMIILFIFSILLTTNAVTYGNWSGTLYTSSKEATDSTESFGLYSAEIDSFLHRKFTGKYVKIIGYVVKKGEKYTISIEYPQNGNEYALFFTGPSPTSSVGFTSISQNKDIPSSSWVRRFNITNSLESDGEKVFVIVSTTLPSQSFKLLIEYPAIADSIVDSSLPNPGCPDDLTPCFWGRIDNTVILKDEMASAILPSKSLLNSPIKISSDANYITITSSLATAYKITNISGKIVSNGTVIQGTQKLSLLNFSSGVYYIQFHQNRETFQESFIVK